MRTDIEWVGGDGSYTPTLPISQLLYVHLYNDDPCSGLIHISSPWVIHSVFSFSPDIYLLPKKYMFRIFPLFFGPAVKIN